MKIMNLMISNLFSYNPVEMSLGRYNVITGINGAGKSHIRRILDRIKSDPSNGFSTCHIEDNEKFDIDRPSWIKIQIEFSDIESRLISKLIFRNKDRRLHECELILHWEGSRPNQRIRCAFILQKKLIIWHDGSQDKIGITKNEEISPDNIFQELNSMGRRDGVSSQQKKYKGGNSNSILTDRQFQKALFHNDSEVANYFNLDGQSFFINHNQDRREGYDNEIYQYCKLPFKTSSVNLWTLLAYIFFKNLIILNEFRANLPNLKGELRNFKRKAATSEFIKLQRLFLFVFPGYRFEISENSQIDLNILRGKRSFKIEEVS